MVYCSNSLASVPYQTNACADLRGQWPLAVMLPPVLLTVEDIERFECASYFIFLVFTQDSLFSFVELLLMKVLQERAGSHWLPAPP